MSEPFTSVGTLLCRKNDDDVVNDYNEDENSGRVNQVVRRVVHKNDYDDDDGQKNIY